MRTAVTCDWCLSLVKMPPMRWTDQWTDCKYINLATRQHTECATESAIEDTAHEGANDGTMSMVLIAHEVCY